MLALLIKVWFSMSLYASVQLANISTCFLHLRNHMELVWVLTASLTELPSMLMALLALRQLREFESISEAVDILYPAHT